MNHTSNFFIDVDFTLAILYKKHRNAYQKTVQNSEYTFDPSKKMSNSYDFMPNAMSIWLDPFWEGKCITFDKIQIPQDKLDDEKTSEACSIFYVKERFYMHNPSIIQRAIDPEFWCMTKKGNQALICNSFKCHFFRTSNTKQGEIERDFLFSSSFPLQVKDFTSDVKMYGLFNYNSTNNTCTPHSDFRLFVQFNQPTTLAPNVSLLCIAGPSTSTHEKVKRIAIYTNDILDKMCPENNSSFKYCATYCRDYGNIALHPCLQTLLDPVSGSDSTSRLPIEILFYSVYHSMLINGVTPECFLEYIIYTKEGGTLTVRSEKYVPIIMRIFRDATVPWTMCGFEGMYWADKSLNQNIEDQPFPFSFLPGRRIFQKDDCEGRVTQMIQMTKLMLSLRAIVQRYRNSSRMAMYYWNKGEEETRLKLSKAKWSCLIKACLCFGDMLKNKTIEVHTTVGDVNFKAFDGKKHATKTSCTNNQVEEMSGHSFATLFYNDGVFKDVSILEATGWERRILKTDKQINDVEKGIMSKLLEGISSECGFHISGPLADESENDVYKNICFGNNVIFLKRENTDIADEYSLNFGAGIGDLRQTINNSVQRVDMDSFFQLLCVMGSDCAIKNEHISPIQINFWKCLKYNKDKKFIQFLKDAPIVAQMYEQYRKEDLPMIKRCLCTPQKLDTEYLQMMKNWSIISESDELRMAEIMKDEGLLPGQCAGILFTIQKHKSQEVKQIIMSYPYLKRGLSWHDFMYSTVFRLRIPINDCEMIPPPTLCVVP